MPLIQPPEQTYSIETDRENIGGHMFDDLTGGYWESPPLMSDVVSDSSCYVLVDKILMEPGDDYKVEANKIWIKDNGEKNIFIKGAGADDSSVVTILYRTEKAYELIPSDFIKQFEIGATEPYLFLVYDRTDKKIKLADKPANSDPIIPATSLDVSTPGFYVYDDGGVKYVALVMTTHNNDDIIQVRWNNSGVQQIRAKPTGGSWSDWNTTITEQDGITKGSLPVPVLSKLKVGVYYFNHENVANVPNMPTITQSGSTIALSSAGFGVRGLLEVIEGDDGFFIERIFMTLGDPGYAKVFYRIVSNIDDETVNWFEVKTK